MTVTVNAHIGPAPVVQVTVVGPVGKNEPEGGLQVTAPHAPVVVGAGYVVAAPHRPGSFGRDTFAGHEIVQAAAATVTQAENSDVLF